MSERQDDRGRTVYLAVLAAMVTSALTTYGLRALDGPADGSDTVEVPSVLGLTSDAAAGVIDARGLRVVVGERAPSLEAAPDTVVRQTPLGGSEVPRGAKIEVVISSGPPHLDVPDVVGKPLAEARATIETAGLTVGDVTRAGTGAPDSVTETKPPAGTEVLAGSSVALVAVPSGILVPDLRGLSRGEATESLEALGLAVGRVRFRYAPSKPELSVLDQEPVPETRVDEGSEVQLTLAE